MAYNVLVGPGMPDRQALEYFVVECNAPSSLEGLHE
jgi:hypothetical protein